MTRPKWKTTSMRSVGDAVPALGMKDAFHRPVRDTKTNAVLFMGRLVDPS